MTKSAFDKIKAGLEDAIAFANGDESRAIVHVPESIDVRAIRKTLGLKQEEFSARYNISLGRLRDWEQGRSWPDGAMRAYLKVIERDHEASVQPHSRTVPGAVHASSLEDEYDVTAIGKIPKIGHLVRVGPDACALDHLDIAGIDTVTEKQER